MWTMLRPTFLFRAAAPTRRFIAPSGIASTRLLTTASPSQPTDAPPAPTQTSADQPSATATTKTTITATIATETETANPAPYLVSRTPSQNLPIYQDGKRGGNLKVTHLKKVAGDAQALKRDLAAALSLRPDQIRLNPVTGHIEMMVSGRLGLV